MPEKQSDPEPASVLGPVEAPLPSQRTEGEPTVIRGRVDGLAFERTTWKTNCQSCGSDDAHEHIEERALPNDVIQYNWLECRDCGQVEGDKPTKLVGYDSHERKPSLPPF